MHRIKETLANGEQDASVLPFGDWRSTYGEAIDIYLDTKLSLFGNLQLKPQTTDDIRFILSEYMYTSLSSAMSVVQKQCVKEQLVACGIAPDEQELEFLLLIAERPRLMEDMPLRAPEKELGYYFFEQYRAPDETWSDKVFLFRKHHSRSHQTNMRRFIEEVAIEMIDTSRASRALAVPATRQERLGIAGADAFFQNAFPAVFSVPAPIAITAVTNVTREFSNHTDHVGRRTYLAREVPHRKHDFMHLAIHETLHLCFPGFSQEIVEEALVEVIIRDMVAAVTGDFVYWPHFESYADLRDSLTRIVTQAPRVKEALYAYVLDFDAISLRQQLSDALDTNARDLISLHSRDPDDMMMHALDRLIAGEEE